MVHTAPVKRPLAAMASYPEQDEGGPDGGELPTYDYLISQEEAKGNPNSR